MWNGEIPFRLQHGDSVYLDFGVSGRIYNARICKIAFTASQVFVDVIVSITHEGEDGINEVRLHNINTAFVFKKD